MIPILSTYQPAARFTTSLVLNIESTISSLETLISLVKSSISPPFFLVTDGDTSFSVRR